MGRPTNAELARRAAESAEPTSGVDSGTIQSAPTDAPLDLNDDIARIKAMRQGMSFGAFDQKMALTPINGYKAHWFNDKPGRVDIAKRAGWTHITNDDGSPKTLVVDSGGLKAYAMKIPQQFWDEDQARQNRKAEAALAATKKKASDLVGSGTTASDQKAFYTPNPSGDTAQITRS